MDEVRTSSSDGRQADRASASRHRVVVVGAGFGGLAVARGLARSDVEVTVIDRHNYHLFQPLLYQVATAALSPADIAWPIRHLLRNQANARVVMGRVTGVETATREVRLEDGSVYPYDTLVLATGARHNYFGRDDWAAFAPGLKKVEDATAIRSRVLAAFEAAEVTADPAARAALLTFVVIGAGPTGVEMAGAIGELAHCTLRREFRSIDTRSSRVILAESGPRVLPTFSEHQSGQALKALQRIGVEVRTGQLVTNCTADGIELGGEHIAAANIIWAAGVAGSPAAHWLGAEADRAGRVIVAPDLTVPEHPEIFVIGDTAAVSGPAGTPVPGVAPAAKQMGEHAARLIRDRLAGRPTRPFRYRDAGALATIGRNAAVAQFGRIGLSGWIAWVVWAVAHIYFLIGARNRLIVALQWAFAWASHIRPVRLITGEAPGERSPDVLSRAA